MSTYFLVEECTTQMAPDRYHIVEGDRSEGQFLCGLHYILAPGNSFHRNGMGLCLGDALPTGSYCTACHIEWSHRQVNYVHRN